MQVTRLEIRRLRAFRETSVLPCPGLNVLTGDNGVGKTSVLEALHLMAYGRSFRGRVRDGLVRSGETDLEIFVEWKEGLGTANPSGHSCRDAGREGRERVRRAGLRHTGQQWTGRLDGEPVTQLGELCAALAVITFEPGSHALVNGPADVRRRYLDWGLFHVEPGFLVPWRRYSRALKQRNALLKGRAGDAQLDAWDRELGEAGELLSRSRQRYLEALHPDFSRLAESLSPGLGTSRLEYLPGWRQQEYPLADALLLARPRDQIAGFTSVGPHRADWRVDFSEVPGRDALSRGQAKLSALVALLAQAQFHADTLGEWPVLGFDDLASELDRSHQQRVLEWACGSGAQIFITGTESPMSHPGVVRNHAMFHVEQGKIERTD